MVPISFADIVRRSAATPVVAPTGVAAVTGTTVIGGSAPAVVSNVPRKAKTIASYIKRNNGATKRHYVGGGEFENNERRLPVGSYREYDVNPRRRGVDRGAERIVVSDDWKFYYTNDHYRTFTQFIVL